MDKKNIKYVSDTEFFEMLNSMKHFSYEDMKDQKVGSIVTMGCRECEGCEEHQKLLNGKCKCLNCGEEQISFT